MRMTLEPDMIEVGEASGLECVECCATVTVWAGVYV
jgi:hypothetical protein